MKLVFDDVGQANLWYYCVWLYLPDWRSPPRPGGGDCLDGERGAARHLVQAEDAQGDV